MRYALLVLVAILSFAAATAQVDLRDRLTEDLCNCLQDGRSQPSRERASMCLLRASGVYELEIADEYGIQVREAGAARALTDTLAEHLSKRCRGLVEWVYGNASYNRWTDAERPDVQQFAYQYPAPNVTPPPGNVAGEVASKIAFMGKLLELSPTGGLRLELETGEEVNLYLPQTVRAKLVWAIGRSYKIHCTRELDREARRFFYLVAKAERLP